MKIAVVGTGYVGLVSGACLADIGHEVCCIDKNPAKIDRLNHGDMPIYEPGLDELVARNVAAGRLRFTQNLQAPVAAADAVFIAVGTPQHDEDGGADLTFFHEAVTDVARAVEGFTVIVTKSTVPVGTGGQVERIVARCNPEADVSVVSNPEFLREGVAIADFMKPDRVVIGCEDRRAQQVMAEIYAPLAPVAPIFFTRRRNSELIKYASNAFLAMKIAFINEIADFCESAGADVRDVAHGMGLDARIGRRFLMAGPGYGGSCFPKDTSALARMARNEGRPLQLVETTIRANAARMQLMTSKILQALGGQPQGRRLAILGLTFKANTDDMREAPSLTIIPALREAGAEIAAHDPAGMAAARPLLAQVDFARDPYAAAQGAHALVILTEWDEYRHLDFARLAAVMARPVLVDLRNLLDARVPASAGFDCIGIGRPQDPCENCETTVQWVPHDHTPRQAAAHSGDGWSRISRLASDRPAGAARSPGHRRRQPAHGKPQ
jgi:UDPglucose 6-dehydrogenase